MIRYDPTLVDLTCFFFDLFTNVKAYLHNFSWWVEFSMNIHEGRGYISCISRNIFMAPVIDVLYFRFFDASTNIKLTNYVYR